MMNIKDLEKFAKWECKRVQKASGKSNKELIEFQILKISEEYGEFVNEFLKLHGWQRKDKMSNEKKIKKEMAEELADIIIVTIAAGHRLNIDIEKELKNKINKVKKRKY